MYLGIEIGGTKLQLGLGDGDGVLHAMWRGAVVPADGADGIRRQITNAVPDLLAGVNETGTNSAASASASAGPSMTPRAPSSSPTRSPAGTASRSPTGSPNSSASPPSSATTPTSPAWPRPSSAPARVCRRSSTSPSAPASAADSSSTARSIAAADAERRKSGIWLYSLANSATIASSTIANQSRVSRRDGESNSTAKRRPASVRTKRKSFWRLRVETRIA